MSKFGELYDFQRQLFLFNYYQEMYFLSAECSRKHSNTVTLLLLKEDCSPQGNFKAFLQ